MGGDFTDKANAVTVVLPCYNAGGRLRAVVEKALEHAAHVVVVDDGCTDGSADSMVDLPLRMVRFERNRGKGHALLAGIAAALERDGCEAVITMDADGQHDAAEIPRFVEAYSRGEKDLIIGARQFGGAKVPLRSRFGNVVTVGVTALLLGRRLPDTQCGFRLVSRRFAEAVLESVPGGRYEFEMEMVVKAVREGWRVGSVPIATIYEPGNVSSHFRKVGDSVRIYARLLRAVLRKRGGRP